MTRLPPDLDTNSERIVLLGAILVKTVALGILVAFLIRLSG